MEAGLSFYLNAIRCLLPSLPEPAIAEDGNLASLAYFLQNVKQALETP
jgi:hypothetical protein